MSRFTRLARKECWALENGGISILPQLVAEFPRQLTECAGFETLMHAAARGGVIEALELLHSAGVPIDQPNASGTVSPLSRAADGGSVEAARWLLERGAQVDGIGKGQCATPLASAAHAGHIEIIRLLLDHGADANASYYLGEGRSHGKLNALTLAMAEGHTEVVELLRAGGAELPTQHSPATRESWGNLREEIIDYLGEHAGRVDPLALVEIIPSDFPVAVNVIRPTPDRNSILLFTTGMSEEAMTVPEGAEEYKYAEVFIELPSNWPLTSESLKDENKSWPVVWLRKLARYPHEQRTWLGDCGIISNNDPPEPFAPDTGLCCMMVLRVSDYGQLIAKDGRPVNFYQLLPMYREERDFCLEQGTDAFAQLLGKHNVDTVIDMKRINVAKEA